MYRDSMYTPLLCHDKMKGEGRNHNGTANAGNPDSTTTWADELHQKQLPDRREVERSMNKNTRTNKHLAISSVAGG